MPEFSVIGTRLSELAAAETNYHHAAHLANVAQSRADAARVMADQALTRLVEACKAASAVTVKAIEP